MTKTFYPRGIFRLPTGGIKYHESILNALLRETHEEMGLDVLVRRLLAAVAYCVAGEVTNKPPVFYTFAFLLDEIDGALGALDVSEQVEAFLEVEPDAFLEVAERPEQVKTTYSSEIEGRWQDWGRFRPVIHRVVWEAYKK